MPNSMNLKLFMGLDRHGHFVCGLRRVKYSWGNTVVNVFDRKSKVVQRDRAYRAEDVDVFDYLKDEVGTRLADRLFDISRKFDRVVELGCARGHFTKNLTSDCVGTIHLCDRVPRVLDQCSLPQDRDIRVVKQVVDEEESLPFDDNSVDLFVSNLYLHWVNDLPRTFSQVNRCLKNDGAFLGAMFGGDTLYELRCSLQVVETERLGGVFGHVSPLTQVSDVGRLLQQAGFTVLTVDTDEIVVGYPSMFELMSDLKGMGENNAVWRRCTHLHRDVMSGAAAVYQAMYGTHPGRVPATFQLVYFIGWKPDPSQPRAAPRGSQSHSFKDLENVVSSPPKTVEA